MSRHPGGHANLHKAVRHTRAVLRKVRPDRNGLLSTSAKDCFRVSVSSAVLDRAVRILEALMLAFEERGYSVVEGDDQHSGLRVKVQDGLLNVTLTERYRQQRHVSPEKEEIRRELNPGWEPEKYEWVPTGALVLRIANAPGHSQHYTWKDKSKEPLEARLNEFLAGLAESARIRREQREAAEKERLRREAQERERQERERKHEVTRARFRFLEQQARLWNRKQQVLAYVEAVKARLADAIFSDEEKMRALEWLDWADDYLASHDPVGILFWNPLITRDDRLYHRYAWHGYDGEHDEWLETWRG